MANILKVNPKVAEMAGVAANANSKTVQAAINGLISNAVSVSGATVNLTAAQAAAALQALQQLQAGAGKTTAATVTAGGTDVTALLSTITKAASTYSIQSLSDKPATGTATQIASTSTTGPVGTAAAQVTNPATTGPATNAATAATAPVTPPVDKSELTPAVTQMLLQSAPATIAAMQTAQQAALAKGDKATADGLGKSIGNLQAQLAAAKTMPPPAATTATTQVASTSPTGPAANATTTQVANPATTGPTTNVATAVTAAAPAPVAPPVDKSELTPAVVQMLLTSGPAAIQAMQSAQQAALAKGDTAMADGLGKDLVNLQAQVAAAKAMPPAASTTTTTTAATTTANPAATTAPVVVAATNPTSPATSAGSPATPANVATAAKATDAQAPTKITTEQGKAVQQALRTVPGNLTKSEEKNLSTLSALVDRAATKGLTPDEAAQLKSGLAGPGGEAPEGRKADRVDEDRQFGRGQQAHGRGCQAARDHPGRRQGCRNNSAGGDDRSGGNQSCRDGRTCGRRCSRRCQAERGPVSGRQGCCDHSLDLAGGDACRLAGCQGRNAGCRAAAASRARARRDEAGCHQADRRNDESDGDAVQVISGSGDASRSACRD